MRQFAPVAPIAAGPLVFVVNPDVPANTMREFIALAKREPGKLNYGSAGPGSINHLALELLNARAGIVVVHIPYKGIAPATQDLLSGQIQAMTGTVSGDAALHRREEGVKALAVTGARRARAAAGRAELAGGRRARRRTSSTTGASSRRRERRPT